MFLLFYQLHLCPKYHNRKKIEPCRISINDSISIFKIHENIKNIDIDILIKTEDVITQKCLNQKNEKEIKKEISVNQNSLIKVNYKTIKNLNISDFKNLIPNKISVIEKRKYKVLIFEAFNFSYSTIGNGYVNLCFKIDKKGSIQATKIIDSKLAMKKRNYYTLFK